MVGAEGTGEGSSGRRHDKWRGEVKGRWREKIDETSAVSKAVKRWRESTMLIVYPKYQQVPITA